MQVGLQEGLHVTYPILDFIDAYFLLEILSFGRCPINWLERHALVLSISYLYSCCMTLGVADLVACACFMSFIPHVDFKPSSSGHESRRYKKEHINRRSTCICLGASLHVIHIVHYWNMIMQYLQVDLDDRGMIESTDLEEVFEVWLNKTMFWGICWKSGGGIWLKPQNRESFRGMTIPIMHIRSLSLSCIRHPHLPARGVLWLLELNDVS